MAPRKPLPTITTRDSEFIAKINAGAKSNLTQLGASLKTMDPLAAVGARKYKAVEPQTTKPEPQIATPEPEAEVIAPAPVEIAQPEAPQTEIAKAEPQITIPEPQSAKSKNTVIVNIGVSLSAETAARAEAWARAGKVEPKTLIRKIAKTQGRQIVAAWQAQGFVLGDDDVKRGHLTTTVPVTLPAEFAAMIEKEHDPLGLLSLGRLISGPYRQAFEAAFIAAAAQMGF